MLLEDKVVIVTGVGPGMGRKLAVLAAAEGASVALAARSGDFLEEVAGEIRQAGVAASPCPRMSGVRRTAGALRPAQSKRSAASTGW